MAQVHHLTRRPAETTRRAELIRGVVDQTKRSTLDGLYTLAYWAEQTNDQHRADELYRAINIVDPTLGTEHA